MKQKARINQSGMTLLEVLIAVFVLAIIALPLLNMFVYNANVVKITGELGDTTYATQAVMEDLQPLGYGALYAFTPKPGVIENYQLKMLGSTQTVTRKVSIDRLPYGSYDNLVSGKACYAHLILSGGTASLTCPDGKRYTGLPYAISFSATQATAGGKTYPLNKPAGTAMILIIHAGSSEISQLTVNLNSTAACVLYALSPEDAKKQAITVNGATSLREYRKYNTSADPTVKDPLPTTMLVKAVCKVYGDGGAVESLAENILKVSLP